MDIGEERKTVRVEELEDPFADPKPELEPEAPLTDPQPAEPVEVPVP